MPINKLLLWPKHIQLLVELLNVFVRCLGMKQPMLGVLAAVAGSESPGNDGERKDGAACLQLQSSKETLCRCVVMALSLQHLSQAVPHIMRRGIHLHGITQDLLRQTVPTQPVKNQALQQKKKIIQIGFIFNPGRTSSSCQVKLQE